MTFSFVDSFTWLSSNCPICPCKYHFEIMSKTTSVLSKVIGFHCFFQLSNIAHNSLVSSPSKLIIFLSVYFGRIQMWGFEEYFSDLTLLGQIPYFFPFFSTFLTFMFLHFCSNVWSTPVEQNETKHLLNHKFTSKKKSQVSRSLLLCGSYI